MKIGDYTLYFSMNSVDTRHINIDLEVPIKVNPKDIIEINSDDANLTVNGAFIGYIVKKEII